MAAYDQVPIQGPTPASYVGPLIDFSPLARLPQEYFQSQQRARTLAQQNSYPNGIPLDQNGRPDLSAIMNTGARLGGDEYARGLVPFLFKQNVLAEDSGGPGPAMATGSSRQASGIASLRNPAGTSDDTAPQQGSMQGTPDPTRAQSDPHPGSVRGMLSGSMSQDDADRLTPVMANQMGVHPDQPLQPDQQEWLRSRFSALRQQAVDDPDSAYNQNLSPTRGPGDHPMIFTTKPGADVAQDQPPRQSMPGAALTPPGWLAQGGRPRVLLITLCSELGGSRSRARPRQRRCGSPGRSRSWMRSSKAPSQPGR